eukprot:TRINITY_DN33571_c0_g1_i1.p1 TRINITY_DN33571_c0_g1~~TRINITY_DN33571_c0_g1_i1.p1  ORF type:complete len:547 (-),score=72.94 TRINITY_DN33571_c0_g1_i1:25-1665(-)
MLSALREPAGRCSGRPRTPQMVRPEFPGAFASPLHDLPLLLDVERSWQKEVVPPNPYEFHCRDASRPPEAVCPRAATAFPDGSLRASATRPSSYDIISAFGSLKKPDVDICEKYWDIDISSCPEHPTQCSHDMVNHLGDSQGCLRKSLVSDSTASGTGSDSDQCVHAIADACDLGKRRIEYVGETAFTDRYDLGEEVMESFHRHTKIYFATRKRDGTTVVVKRRLKPDCFRDQEDERDWREMTEFLLNLPPTESVAHVQEVLESDEAFFVVTELVKGSDMFEFLDRLGNVEVRVAREMIYQLLEAVRDLHKHGGVHRDLKLENIMINPEALMSLEVTSPSRSRRVPDVAASTSQDMPRFLKMIDFDTVILHGSASMGAKELVGTHQYISPEAYEGMYSSSSDMFAVGVIAYRVLTGCFPFDDRIFESGWSDVGVSKAMRMRSLRRKICAAKISWKFDVFTENPAALDLVKSLLSSKDERPTAEAALMHKWFFCGLGSTGRFMFRTRTWSSNWSVFKRAKGSRHSMQRSVGKCVDSARSILTRCDSA